MELQGRKVSLKSGSTLYVNPANYADTEEFLSSFLESVAGFPLVDETGTVDPKMIKVFAETTVAKAFTRPALKSALWKCLAYCLYVKTGGQTPEKVTPQLFDTQSYRGDLPFILYECAYENLIPFLSGLWNVSNNLESQVRSFLK